MRHNLPEVGHNGANGVSVLVVKGQKRVLPIVSWVAAQGASKGRQDIGAGDAVDLAQVPKGNVAKNKN